MIWLGQTGEGLQMIAVYYINRDSLPTCWRRCAQLDSIGCQLVAFRLWPKLLNTCHSGVEGTFCSNYVTICREMSEFLLQKYAFLTDRATDYDLLLTWSLASKQPFLRQQYYMFIAHRNSVHANTVFSCVMVALAWIGLFWICNPLCNPPSLQVFISCHFWLNTCLLSCTQDNRPPTITFTMI